MVRKKAAVAVAAGPEKIDVKPSIVTVESLLLDPRNARVHDDENLGAIRDSLQKFGQQRAIVVEAGGRVIAGNGTLMVARELGWKYVAITESSLTGDIADAYGIADNQSATLAKWNDEALADTLKRLEAVKFDLGSLHFDPAELDRLLERSEPPVPLLPGGGLSERFLLPPFTVLDARQGYWQARKRQWLSLGIASEVGRGANLLARSLYERISLVVKRTDLKQFVDDCRAKGMSDDEIVHAAGGKLPVDLQQKGEATASFKNQDKLSALRKRGKTQTQGAVPGNKEANADSGHYYRKQKKAIPGGGEGERSVYAFKTEAGYEKGLEAQQTGTGTSIFDPVLCELACMWFSPKGGAVLDPFSGGSVRGIVSGKLGRTYLGIDLRQEQIDANEAQARQILGEGKDGEGYPTWLCGDSLQALDGVHNDSFDLVFSCPPYADLEVYSDDKRDLSTMAYDKFMDAYSDIIIKAVAKLRPNRFVFWVVGDVRESKGGGFYRGFVPDTIRAFEAAGARLYNEAVLVTSVGTLPLRTPKIFAASRKLGKTHQNVLVFCKGDPRKAVQACGEVEVWQPTADEMADAAAESDA